MRLIRLSLIVLIVALCGCSAYQPYNKGSGGFESTWMGGNTYKVFYAGGELGWKGTAKDFALLRCAEITLERGYAYFILLESGKEERCILNGYPIVFPTPGPMIQPYYYFISYTIVCYKEKPDSSAYDAEATWKSIRAKHGLDIPSNEIEAKPLEQRLLE